MERLSWIIQMGPMQLQRFLKEKEGNAVSVRERLEDATLLNLKMEKGTKSQGIQVASRSLKTQGNRFSPRTSTRNTAFQHLDFSPKKPV